METYLKGKPETQLEMLFLEVGTWAKLSLFRSTLWSGEDCSWRRGCWSSCSGGLAGYLHRASSAHGHSPTATTSSAHTSHSDSMSSFGTGSATPMPHFQGRRQRVVRYKNPSSIVLAHINFLLGMLKMMKCLIMAIYLNEQTVYWAEHSSPGILGSC